MSRSGDTQRVLILSIAMAVLLQLLPLPGFLDPLRPYWPGLVLIYWTLETVDTIHLGTAFLIGLLLDVLTGSLMGLHALSLVVLVYLVQRFRARLRFFPPWQQALSVLGLLINDRIILLWITTLMGEPAPTWRFWLPPLSGLLLWPWLFLLLDRLRIGRRINKT
jgi:rod shape-determining protein MreD